MATDYINISADTISIDLPSTFGLGGGNIIFRKDHLVYNNATVNYKDIESICYQTVKTSINLVPTDQSYTFRIKASNKNISFVLKSVLFFGNKKYMDIFSRLISISKTLIEPTLVNKLVFQIFEANKPVQIGRITISMQGYSIDKFWGGRVQVLWIDKIYVPTYHEGYVHVYKEHGGKAKSICQISMATDNAVILPELIKHCYVRARE